MLFNFSSTYTHQSNILVNNDGVCCLADFGISKIVETQKSGQLSTTSRSPGTVRWMAPELMNERRREEYRQRPAAVDIYSFACVALEVGTRCQTDLVQSSLTLSRSIPSSPHFMRFGTTWPWYLRLPRGNVHRSPPKSQTSCGSSFISAGQIPLQTARLQTKSYLTLCFKHHLLVSWEFVSISSHSDISAESFGFLPLDSVSPGVEPARKLPGKGLHSCSFLLSLGSHYVHFRWSSTCR